jgi:uncharacterized protein
VPLLQLPPLVGAGDLRDLQPAPRTTRRSPFGSLPGRRGVREQLFSAIGGASARPFRCRVERQVPGPKAGPGVALHPTRCCPEQARDSVTSLTAEEVIRLLGLAPHPEGGFFRETFRARQSVAGPRPMASRAASTAIYFLLRAGEFSAFHTVLSDEVWHHYLGATLELHTIDRAGMPQRVELGPQLQHGECPQWVVPAGTLQAARVIGEGFALCGCTVAPGFDFADFDMPSRSVLSARYPALADLIESFTR